MSLPIKAEDLATAFEPSSQPENTSVRESIFRSEIDESVSVRNERHNGGKPGVAGLRTARSIWKLIKRRPDAYDGGSSPVTGAPRVAARVGTSRDSAGHQVFMNCPLTRTGPDTHRIVYVGELTPRGGAVEFVSSAIAWAEANPEAQIEIMWLGEGDLLGVLQAQPAPANLVQTFARIPSSNGLATLMERCGIFVMPGLTDLQHCWITEAMAAGLPVLGSVRDTRVRALVVQNESGWLFDPLREKDMAAALNAALIATPARLDEMRTAAHARIRALHDEPSTSTVNRAARDTVARTLAYKAPA
jgi:glycosyltransferase involved in cell wall biosynthesis